MNKLGYRLLTYFFLVLQGLLFSDLATWIWWGAGVFVFIFSLGKTALCRIGRIQHLVSWPSVASGIFHLRDKQTKRQTQKANGHVFMSVYLVGGVWQKSFFVVLVCCVVFNYCVVSFPAIALFCLPTLLCISLPQSNNIHNLLQSNSAFHPSGLVN